MNTCINRRQSLGLLGAASLGLMGPVAWAQAPSWKPTERVNYILGVAPGGSVDIYARGIQETLTQMNLLNGQTLLIDYKPGGAGTISLGLGTFHTSTLVAIAAGMLKTDLREYPPVAMMVEETQMVAVRADSPIRHAQDLVAVLRKDPTALKIGVAPSLGSGTHLSVAKPLKEAGVNIRQLTVAPFKASSESMVALLGGHIDVISATAPVIMPQVAAGKVRAIASASPTRGNGDLAEVPTWREQGVDAVYTSSQGLLGAKGLSAAQIAFWEETLRRATDTPEWRAFLARNHWKPRFMGATETRRYLDAEAATTKTLLGDLGLLKR